MTYSPNVLQISAATHSLFHAKFTSCGQCAALGALAFAILSNMKNSYRVRIRLYHNWPDALCGDMAQFIENTPLGDGSLLTLERIAVREAASAEKP